jgi:photosystem II stability/assembly factor-like uncharacterized protein
MATWQALTNCPVNQNLHGVWAIDSNNVVIVGNGGVILTTDDGGATWNIIPNPLGVLTNLNGVCFATAQDGWIVGDAGMILRSSDGGQSWALDLNAGGSSLRSISMVQMPNGTFRGICVGDNGAARVNQGNGWNLAPVSGNPNLRSVSAVVSSAPQGWEAWAAGSPQNPGMNGSLAHYPGGWMVYNNFTSRFFGASLVSRDSGWAVGDAGAIRKKGVGDPWNSQSSPSGTSKLNAVSMLPDGQGCAVGDCGCLLWCLGGGSWSAMANPAPLPYPAMNGVYIESDTNGWGVGNAANGQGTILVYS